MHSEWLIQDLKLCMIIKTISSFKHKNLHSLKLQGNYCSVIFFEACSESEILLAQICIFVFFFLISFHFSPILFWFVVVSLTFVMLCHIPYPPLILLVLDWKYTVGLTFPFYNAIIVTSNFCNMKYLTYSAGIFCVVTSYWYLHMIK